MTRSWIGAYLISNFILKLNLKRRKRRRRRRKRRILESLFDSGMDTLLFFFCFIISILLIASSLVNIDVCCGSERTP